MARNQKLTAVIRGRKVESVEQVEGQATVTFGDGSRMVIRTGAPLADPTPTGTVKAVRQRGTLLQMDYEEGGTLEVTTAEETSSVLLRDRDQRFEYAD
ncbi:MAG TPA: hypothetical protein VGN26_22115 [Armatimonadota bacterium]